MKILKIVTLRPLHFGTGISPKFEILPFIVDLKINYTQVTQDNHMELKITEVHSNAHFIHNAHKEDRVVTNLQ